LTSFLEWDFWLDYYSVYLFLSDECIGDLLVAEENGIPSSDERSSHYRIEELKGMLLTLFFTWQHANL
jgi:hypothetical protein